MAYNPSNLSALSYANGFTLWHYKTPDALSEVLEPGYFNPASSQLRPGDFLYINTSFGAGDLYSFQAAVTGTVAVTTIRVL